MSGEVSLPPLTLDEAARQLLDLWADGEANEGQHDLDLLDRYMERLALALPPFDDGDNGERPDTADLQSRSRCSDSAPGQDVAS